jgi:16S rRNA (guanine966-N2)-methyltransferase
MRVVAGNLGGRNFEAPPGHRTHPMSDKVRGALFNILGDIGGLTVLDAFAGSGALSIEAISQGAASAAAIDIDKGANKTLVKSVHDLGLEGRIKVIRANAGGWSDNNPDTRFDLVFCDPPYDNINESLLQKLAAHTKPGGVVVYSLPPNSDFSLSTINYQLLTIKRYGDAQLVFYRKTS